MLETETKEKGKKGLLIPEMVEDLNCLFFDYSTCLVL